MEKAAYPDVSMNALAGEAVSLLAIARNAVECDDAVLSGMPCFKGTRIPVHYVSDLFTNGDSVDAVLETFPRLSGDQIQLALVYARAHPMNDRTSIEPSCRTYRPVSIHRSTLDELPAEER